MPLNRDWSARFISHWLCKMNLTRQNKKAGACGTRLLVCGDWGGLQVVSRLPVFADVQTLALALFGHAQADDGINDLVSDQ